MERESKKPRLLEGMVREKRRNDSGRSLAYINQVCNAMISLIDVVVVVGEMMVRMVKIGLKSHMFPLLASFRKGGDVNATTQRDNKCIGIITCIPQRQVQSRANIICTIIPRRNIPRQCASIDNYFCGLVD